VRVKAPVPDLTCYEMLLSVDAGLVHATPRVATAPTTAPKGQQVVIPTMAGAPCLTKAPSPRFAADAARVDNFYWEKHALLTTMLGGFTGLMVHKFDQFNAERPPERRKVLDICRTYHEKRTDMPPGKLKTIADMEHIDKLIADMLGTHTRLIAHLAQKRVSSPGAAAQAPLAKRVKREGL